MVLKMNNKTLFKNIKMNNEILLKSAENGYINCLKYSLQHGCIWNSYTASKSA